MPPVFSRSSRGRVAGGLVLGLLGAGLLAACESQVVLAPVAPGRIENTVVAGGRGVVDTATPTAGPSPTATVAATRVVGAPEPLTLPPGFGVGVYADGLGPVWNLALAPNGDLFATVPEGNRILALPDRDQDGVADQVSIFAEEGGLNAPYGLAFRDDGLYVANTDTVLRFPYRQGDLVAGGSPELVTDLPGGGEVPWRGLAFGPDGGLYVSVGASCNVCVEQDPRRASILRFDLGGEPTRRVGGGIRAALGLSFHPETGELWAPDLGREGLGDDLPPDEVNRVVPGDFGWPHCFGDRRFDAAAGGEPILCETTIAPALTFQAHSVPLGATFYTGAMFPPEYRNNLIVALHGSAHRRAIPAGYNLVRMPFVSGVQTGEVFDFASGWLRPDTRRWGSPVDVTVAPDGALLVSDDGGGRIYRVYYAATPTPRPR